MTDDAIERDERAVLLVAGRDPRERISGPGNAGRCQHGRLRLTGRAAVGGEANRAAERCPGIERGTVLLKATEHEEAKQERHDGHRPDRPPGNARQGIIELEWALFAHHYGRPPASEELVTATAGTECCFKKKNCPIG